MYPTLFEIGPITIHSFGLMVAFAFLSANYLLTKEARRLRLPNADNLSSTITLLALIGGLAGAKLFHILENPGDLARNGLGAIFSGEGLTFYGGLVTAIVLIMLYARAKKVKFLQIADAAAPGLLLAYGVGRVGCHLSGDGDYGIPTDVSWATSYAKGLVPTLSDRNPDLVEYFKNIFPGRPIPEDILVHPTPVYETIACVALFFVLWKLRLRGWAVGRLFGLYLIFAGLERFAIEFIRMNPLYLGLSQAQYISIALIILGGILMAVRRGSQDIPAQASRGTR